MSDEQRRFTNEIYERVNRGNRNFNDIYIRAKSSLSNIEYKELEQVLMSMEVLVRSLDTFKNVVPNSQLRSIYLERFVCGAVTSEIGSVWGTMAGGALTLAVSVPVAGWIGAAVGLLSSAAIGAALC